MTAPQSAPASYRKRRFRLPMQKINRSACHDQRNQNKQQFILPLMRSLHALTEIIPCRESRSLLFWRLLPHRTVFFRLSRNSCRRMILIHILLHCRICIQLQEIGIIADKPFGIYFSGELLILPFSMQSIYKERMLVPFSMSLIVRFCFSRSARNVSPIIIVKNLRFIWQHTLAKK